MSTISISAEMPGSLTLGTKREKGGKERKLERAREKKRGMREKKKER